MATNNTTYGKTPIPLEFPDGTVLHLRYSVAAMRRINERYDNLLGLSLWDFMPVIHEGLLEKDKYTVDDLLEKVDGQMSEYVFNQFWLAYKGKTFMQMLEEIRDLKNVARSLTE